jgi:NAD(P)-dependent dehydrogenase (short-subunit alcohol dehydrogenase family)
MTTHTTPSIPTVALVTGANKGIGRETVRRLASLGWTVWLGARDAERGKAAASELAGAGDVRFVELDVTQDVSVSDAAALIADESGRLDVLVNNAGIPGGFVAPRDVTAAEFIAVFGVNMLGPVRVTRAFLGLLDRSARPRVVMVSSGMGSFGVTTDPARFESTLHGVVYASSKAALNMVTSQYPVREVARRLPGQRRRPRLHLHRPQRAPRDAEHRAGRRGRRAGCDARAGRADRRVPHGRRLPALARA